MTTTYEFTAFQESDLVAGDLNCGDRFTMPANATICFEVKDDDRSLSGDSWRNEHADDHTHQTAKIIDPSTGQDLGNGGQIYAEKYFWVKDVHTHKWYMMIQVEQEGSHEDYFTFHSYHGTPPAGAELCVGGSCEIKSWEPDYNCLDAGDKTANQAPDAVDDSFSYFEDETGGVFDGNSILGNDTDPEGNTLTVTAVNGESIGDGKWIELDKGAVFVSKDGQIDFDAQGDFASLKVGESEQVTFTYDISDGNGGTDTATVTLNVEGKVQFGSISGTVWCDVDCDGLQDVGSSETRTVIAHEDFTGGADAGWWDRWTMDSDSGDTYLGGFGNTHRTTEDTSKAFAVPAGADTLEIEFDFLEIDSWDGESFFAFINGHRIDLGDFRHGHDEGDRDIDAGNGISVRIESQGDGKSDLGYGKDHWADQVHKVSITVEDPGSEVRIGFGSSLNQDKHDESWGVDNLKLTAVSSGAFELGPDLIVNGDFENNSLNDSGALWDLETGDLPGWFFVGNGKADLLEENAEGHGNATGQAIIDLDKGSILCQEVTIAEAGTYVLTLDLLENPHISADSNRIKIFVNGVETEIVRAEGQNTVSVQLHLDAGTTRLDFKSTTTVNDGPGVDAIRLQQKTAANALGEPVKEGVIVALLDADGNPVLDAGGNAITTVTDADGNYAFDSVAEGDYQVQFTAPDGTVFTDQNVGSDDTIDSDVDANGNSGLITVEADQVTDVDAGLKDAPTEVIATDDCIIVGEEEGAGDTEVLDGGATTILTNDLLDGGAFTGDVITVNGAAANVGAFVQLFDGGGNSKGRVKINADGTVDFDADGDGDGVSDFDALVAGETELVTVTYEIGVEEHTDILVEDVWFAAEPCPMLDQSDHSVHIEWGYDRDGDSDGPGGHFELDIDFDAKDLPFDAKKIISVDTTAIQDYLTSIGATRTFQEGDDSGHSVNINVEGVGFALTDQQVRDFARTDLEIVVTYEDSNGQHQTSKVCLDFTQDIDIYSPLTFDLNGDGSIGVTGNSTAQVRANSDVNATVEFDLDGDGEVEQIEWLSGDGDGLLIDNRDGNAATDMDGNRLFGDLGGTFANGFENLAQLDTNGDNVISGAELTGLQLWVDDGNAQVDAGELRELSEFNITEIATTFQNVTNAAGETLMQSVARQTELFSDAATVTIKIQGEDDIGTIAGRAFCDDNGSGLDDAGDTPVQQQLVVLLNPDGTPALDSANNPFIAFTGLAGEYSFTDVPVGDYRVGFEIAGNKGFIPQGEDLDGDGRSDNDAASDVNDQAAPVVVDLFGTQVTVQATDTFTVNPGEDVTDVDAGQFFLNRAPDAQDDAFTTVESTPLFVDLLADNGSGADTDPDGDTLLIVEAGGVQLVNQVATFSVTSAGGREAQVAVTETGAPLNFSLDPTTSFADLNDGETDTLTISYTVSDGNGLTDTASVTVTVEGEGQPTATVSGTIGNTGPGERNIAIIMDTSMDAVNLATGFQVQDLDNNGNDGTAVDLMLSKISDLALTLNPLDQIALIPSGFSGLPDTPVVVPFSAGALQQAIADDADASALAGTTVVTAQQALYSPITATFAMFDFTIDWEQGFDAANDLFQNSTGFDQNKVIAMVSSESTFLDQGGNATFFGDATGAFTDLSTAPSNADVDVLVIPSNGFVDASRLEVLDSDGVVDVDTNAAFGLDTFIDPAPTVAGAADILSFEITVAGTPQADIDLGDLTATADGFSFAPTEIVEGEIDVLIGLDTDLDGNVDETRALSDTLSVAERTLAEGDVFDFTLDAFASDQIA